MQEFKEFLSGKLSGSLTTGVINQYFDSSGNRLNDFLTKLKNNPDYIVSIKASLNHIFAYSNSTDFNLTPNNRNQLNNTLVQYEDFFNSQRINYCNQIEICIKNCLIAEKEILNVSLSKKDAFDYYFNSPPNYNCCLNLTDKYIEEQQNLKNEFIKTFKLITDHYSSTTEKDLFNHFCEKVNKNFEKFEILVKYTGEDLKLRLEEYLYNKNLGDTYKKAFFCKELLFKEINLLLTPIEKFSALKDWIRKKHLFDDTVNIQATQDLNKKIRSSINKSQGLENIEGYILNDFELLALLSDYFFKQVNFTNDEKTFLKSLFSFFIQSGLSNDESKLPIILLSDDLPTFQEGLSFIDIIPLLGNYMPEKLVLYKRGIQYAATKLKINESNLCTVVIIHLMVYWLLHRLCLNLGTNNPLLKDFFYKNFSQEAKIVLAQLIVFKILENSKDYLFVFNSLLQNQSDLYKKYQDLTKIDIHEILSGVEKIIVSGEAISIDILNTIVTKEIVLQGVDNDYLEKLMRNLEFNYFTYIEIVDRNDKYKDEIFKILQENYINTFSEDNWHKINVMFLNSINLEFDVTRNKINNSYINNNHKTILLSLLPVDKNSIEFKNQFEFYKKLDEIGLISEKYLYSKFFVKKGFNLKLETIFYRRNPSYLRNYSRSDSIEQFYQITEENIVEIIEDIIFPKITTEVKVLTTIADLNETFISLNLNNYFSANDFLGALILGVFNEDTFRGILEGCKLEFINTLRKKIKDEKSLNTPLKKDELRTTLNNINLNVFADEIIAFLHLDAQAQNILVYIDAHSNDDEDGRKPYDLKDEKENPQEKALNNDKNLVFLQYLYNQYVKITSFRETNETKILCYFFLKYGFRMTEDEIDNSLAITYTERENLTDRILLDLIFNSQSASLENLAGYLKEKNLRKFNNIIRRFKNKENLTKLLLDEEIELNYEDLENFIRSPETFISNYSRVFKINLLEVFKTFKDKTLEESRIIKKQITNYYNPDDRLLDKRKPFKSVLKFLLLQKGIKLNNTDFNFSIDYIFSLEAKTQLYFWAEKAKISIKDFQKNIICGDINLWLSPKITVDLKQRLDKNYIMLEITDNKLLGNSINRLQEYLTYPITFDRKENSLECLEYYDSFFLSFKNRIIENFVYETSTTINEKINSKLNLNYLFNQLNFFSKIDLINKKESLFYFFMSIGFDKFDSKVFENVTRALFDKQTEISIEPEVINRTYYPKFNHFSFPDGEINRKWILNSNFFENLRYKTKTGKQTLFFKLPLLSSLRGNLYEEAQELEVILKEPFSQDEIDKTLVTLKAMRNIFLYVNQICKTITEMDPREISLELILKQILSEQLTEDEIKLIMIFANHGDYKKYFSNREYSNAYELTAFDFLSKISNSTNGEKDFILNIYDIF